MSNYDFLLLNYHFKLFLALLRCFYNQPDYLFTSLFCFWQVRFWLRWLVFYYPYRFCWIHREFIEIYVYAHHSSSRFLNPICQNHRCQVLVTVSQSVAAIFGQDLVSYFREFLLFWFLVLRRYVSKCRNKCYSRQAYPLRLIVGNRYLNKLSQLFRVNLLLELYRRSSAW